MARPADTLSSPVSRSRSHTKTRQAHHPGMAALPGFCFSGPGNAFRYRLMHTPITTHKAVRQKQLTAFRLSAKTVSDSCFDRPDLRHSLIPAQRKPTAQTARMILIPMNMILLLQSIHQTPIPRARSSRFRASASPLNTTPAMFSWIAPSTLMGVSSMKTHSSAASPNRSRNIR